MFGSSPLSLALPKLENLGDTSLTRQSCGLAGRRREDELENRSESDSLEVALGDDQNTSGNRSSKRKNYHKHSAFQIQELETSFKENPHPDEKWRLELGERLGLEIRQIKFWFQNRRTQMKFNDCHENLILKEENDKLSVENVSVKEAIRCLVCNNCGGPTIPGGVPIEQHHLLIENARLKNEINRLGLLAKKFRGLEFGNQASHGFSVRLSNGPVTSLTNVNTSFDKSLLLELALAAMDELIKLSQLDSPLWFRNIEGSGESLDFEEYKKTFSSCIDLKPGHFVSDGTRYTGVVMIKSVTLMEILMNVPKMENLGDMSLTRQSYGLSGRRRVDELENRSESDNLEAASGDDQNTSGNGSSKRKKYHKHSAFQIQELETSFKDNPHPDEKQRAEIGERLGLEIQQIKFWFQNRRTQMNVTT
ncbi:hypothetical protein RD792_005342 [Penstemon davidsonii]|uniref:Uncharacterized protein n=1 Tax=Penstemon davidsonii TaxID=160366 RepID=A0ABR0DL87_9LAMI|nr:hypothetical protein RD792_005342 [Penstemon davidsonii]